MFWRKIMNISKEDYLKTIYELGGEKEQVSNKDIAKVLKISPPSVSEMIKKLLQDGYVEYTVYQGIRLTEYGAEEARKIRRRHLLWEVFLVEKLGYDPEEVHDEAEKLEHVTNKKLEEKLDEYLNYPKVCPHGSNIIREE
jgi:DtxR family Mn-dependent transcriptional regulator